MTSAATILETIGEMMHYEQYAEHAETHAGGKLNESEIIRQWTEWETQLRQPGSTWPPKDSQGSKASPLRIWVKTKDVLKFQQMEMQQKQLTFTSGAPEKDVTEANILKGFARIQKPNLEFSSIRCDSEAAGSAMIAA